MELNINTEILVWAIQRAGLTVQDIEKGFPNFSRWLTKDVKPTINQLENFSSKVHIPFGYLFLDSPPNEELPIPFFRTLSNESNKISLNVYETILILQRRQQWLVEHLKDDETDKLDYVGKFTLEHSYKTIAQEIKTKLSLGSHWACNFPNWELAKEHLIKKIEEIGIITVFNSVVANNTHRSIKVDDCRGFVLVDEFAPFMFVNAADSKAAQLFTIAHELGHIWLGKSAGFDFRSLLPSSDPVELFCDKIAAEFLVPEDELSQIYHDHQDIVFLSKYFKVSQIVIARRLLDLNFITKDYFLKFYEEYIKIDFSKKSNSDGGDFYNTQKKRISLRFISIIDQAVKQNKLLVRDAYNLTDLKGNTYHKFVGEYIH